MANSQDSVNIQFSMFTTFPRHDREELTSDERAEFRALIGNKTFQKALRNAYLKKPSAMSGAVTATEFSALQNNNILHLIRGWDFFEAALFGQLDTSRLKGPKVLNETFPDSGVFGNYEHDKQPRPTQG